jgi:hypothetical protein
LVDDAETCTGQIEALEIHGKWTEFLWRAKKFDSSSEAAKVAYDHDCLVFGDWQLPKYMALEIDAQLREKKRELLTDLTRQVDPMRDSSVEWVAIGS